MSSRPQLQKRSGLSSADNAVSELFKKLLLQSNIDFMPWRWSNPDARPISDYLYDYHSFRKSHRFLYYCRECIRNFDTTERVEKCPKCNQKSVIELPKDTRLEHKSASKKYGKKQFTLDLFKARKELATMLVVLQKSLWRAKIAMYYFFIPVPEELK